LLLDSLPPVVAPLFVFLHGAGHAGAIGALAWIAARPDGPRGDWTPAHSWLTAIPPTATTAIAVATYAACFIGFVLAALGIAGVAPFAAAWQPLAMGAAVVSLAGIALFLGNWPVFNTVAAIAANIVILASALVTSA
jgi:hypothetical protein